MLDLLLNVLEGDQPLQHPVLVHHRELLDLVLLQDMLRLLERRADRSGDEILLGHDRGDQLVLVGLKAQIPVGDDADQPVPRSSTTGMPEILYLFMSARTSRTRWSARTVTGFRIMPLSERFTLSTSSACA